jgi:hypothetical protein
MSSVQANGALLEVEDLRVSFAVSGREVRAVERCAAEVPEPRELFPGHLVACHFPLTEAVEPAAAEDAPATQAVEPRTTKAVSQ